VSAQCHSLYRRYRFVKLNDESDSYPFWPGTSRLPLAKSNEAQNTRLAGTVRFLAPINGFPNVASKVSAIGLAPSGSFDQPACASPDYSRNNANMMQSLWSKGVATILPKTPRKIGVDRNPKRQRGNMLNSSLTLRVTNNSR